MSGIDSSCDIRELLFSGVTGVAVLSDFALASFWGKALRRVCVLLFKEFCLHKPFSTSGLLNYGN